MARENSKSGSNPGRYKFMGPFVTFLIFVRHIYRCKWLGIYHLPPLYIFIRIKHSQREPCVLERAGHHTLLQTSCSWFLLQISSTNGVLEW